MIRCFQKVCGGVQSERRSSRRAGVFLIAPLLAALPACGNSNPLEESASVIPAVVPEAAFVKDGECAGCHAGEASKWSESHHAKAMQPATEETVLGDFDNAVFRHFDVETRFFKKGNRFFVRTEGPDGQAATYEIRYTFGLEPLQQYLIEFPGGRLQCLTVSWDTGRKRWFHLYPDQRIRTDDPLHWTGRYQNWNLMCGECHTTNLKKRYDPATDSYQSTWDEIDVGCQSCHGPGEAHVRWAKTEDAGGTWYEEGENYGLLVDLKSDSRRQVDACAPCHSRRGRLTAEYPHFGKYADHFRVETLNEGLYYADGQILDEVYVNGSFLQSKMFQAGVRCTDCHDPHTARLKAQGNDVCLQCHQVAPTREFSGLKGADYDSREHHFHPEGAEGSRCVDCHMPERVYMVVDPRRDHSFRIPRPDLSMKLGVPNACIGCHRDRNDEWAADQIRKHHEDTVLGQFHYAEAIAAGRRNSENAVELLTRVAGDSKQPEIVRATAFTLLRNHPEGPLDIRLNGLTEGNALVRASAVRSLEFVNPDLKKRRIGALLDDPILLVRTEAARTLVSVPAGTMEPNLREGFESALQEYIQTQLSVADMPSSHLNLGAVYEARGMIERAEEAYQTAIRMDPFFLPARVNLANLYNRQGRNEAAEEVLREAIQRSGEEGELHYSLGLLLAEMGRLEEAADSLARASHMLPNRARIRYNYALTLQHLGREGEAETALLRAHDVDPDDPDILYALVVFYVQQEDWQTARDYAWKLTRVSRNPEASRRLLAEIESKLTR